MHEGFAYSGKRNHYSGADYEKGIWADAVLFRVGDGTAFVYSRDYRHTVLYYRLPRIGVFFVLLLNFLYFNKIQLKNMKI